MSRKNETITLSLSQEDKLILEEIALKYGQTWGEKPNLSKLMRAIAQGKLRVTWDDEEKVPIPDSKRLAEKEAISLIQEGLSKLIRLI